MTKRCITVTEGRKRTFLIDERVSPVSVCAYCRVSTDKNDQKNSFEVQKAFFEREFQKRDNWVGRAIFADRGISGTSLARRDEFCRMLEQARRREFDLILTKEVSRFSRNVKDILDLVTELHRLGVYIWFLTDDIYTEAEDYREALIKAGEQAEAESRRTSRRVRWGQRRQMENGVIFGSASLFGYKIVKNEGGEQHFEVVEAEAETVRRIFSLYADGMGTTRIARLLEAEGVRTKEGSARFRSATLLRLLRNEKYVGDLALGKTYTPDFLTHRRAVNRGESLRVYIESDHPRDAIVDRELWQRVQARLPKEGEAPRQSRRAWHSGRLFCECGSAYVSTARSRKDGERYRLFRCLSGGDGVHGEGLNEKVLQGAVRLVFSELVPLPLDRIFACFCGICGEEERRGALRAALLNEEHGIFEAVYHALIERIEVCHGHILRFTLLGGGTPLCLRYEVSGRGKSYGAVFERI